jgi:hypothetical protein
MHPLAGDLSVMKDAELDLKIQDLTKKYFQTIITLISNVSID